MSEFLFFQLISAPSVKRQQLAAKRLEKKLAEASARLAAAEEQSAVFRSLGEDLFEEDIVRGRKPAELKRQQSLIFNKLHPDQVRP